MHGYFGCNAAAEPEYSAFLGTPQASPSYIKKKKNLFRKSIVLLMKFRQRNIVPLVLICTFYILLHWDYPVLRDFFVCCFRFPPFLAVVQPYHFSLLVQKNVVNSVAE